MKNAFFLFLTIVWSASLISCDEDITDTPAKPSENFDDVDAMPFKSDSVDVLIAGAVSSSEGQWRACFWKNDSIQLLEERPSIANDVLVMNEEVIAAGKYDGKPCLWRNGERTLLDTQRYGEVKAIGLMNGKLYLVGELYETQTNFRAFIWMEGKMTFLNDYKGYASDIASSGKDIHISGMDSEKPCYWKNGLKIELSSHFGQVYGIEVIGNDVFVGGEYRPSGGGHFLAGFGKMGFSSHLQAIPAMYGVSGLTMKRLS